MQQEIKTVSDIQIATYAIVISPDGKTAASAGESSVIYVWETHEKKIICILSKHTDKVVCLAFSSCGKYIVSGSWDKTAIVWDICLMKAIMVLSAHEKGVSSVSFNPSGSQVATASSDGSVRIWDVSSGKVVRKFTKHRGVPVKSLAFSPDGRLIASGASDGGIIVWSPDDKATCMPKKGHPQSVTRLIFGSDNTTLYSASEDRTFAVWDAYEEEPRKIVHSHNGKINSMTLSGNLLVTSSIDGRVYGWDITDDMEKKWKIDTAAKRSMYSSAWCSDINTVFTGHSSGVHSWHVSPAETGASDVIKCIAVSSKGDAILACFSKFNLLLVRDFVPKVTKWNAHAARITSVAFSRDGLHVVSGDADGTIKLWKAADLVLINKLDGHTAGIKTVSFSDDGRFILSGGSDAALIVWDTSSASIVTRINCHAAPVKHAFFYDKTKCVSISSDRCVFFHDMSIRGCIHSERYDVNITAAIGKDNEIWTGSGEGAVCKTVDCKRDTKAIKTASGAVQSIAISDDNTMLVTGSADNTVKTWDVKTRQLLAVMRAHKSRVVSVFVLPSSDIVSASCNGDIMLSDARTGIIKNHINVTDIKQSVMDNQTEYETDVELLIQNIPVGSDKLPEISMKRTITDGKAELLLKLHFKK